MSDSITPVIILLHILVCTRLAFQSLKWRRLHADGADSYKHLLPMLLLAGAMGYLLMLISVRASNSWPEYWDLAHHKKDYFTAPQRERWIHMLITLVPAVPLFGLVPSVVRKPRFVACLACLSALFGLTPLFASKIC